MYDGSDDEELEMPEPDDGGEIFVMDGEPLCIFLHHSLTEGQCEALRNVIQGNGGIIVEDREECKVIVIHEDLLESTRSRYSLAAVQWLRDIQFEPIEWVKKCTRRKRCEYTVPIKQGMPGRPIGFGSWKRFTLEEEDFLCWYLSRLCPDPRKGGRQAKNLYKQLVELGKYGYDPETNTDYSLAANHSWESWKTYYRKHAKRLDLIIAEYAAENPPRPDQQYPKQRRIDFWAANEDESQEGYELEGDTQEDDQDIDDVHPHSEDENLRKRRRSQRTESYRGASRDIPSPAKRPRQDRVSKAGERAPRSRSTSHSSVSQRQEARHGRENVSPHMKSSQMTLVPTQPTARSHHQHSQRISKAVSVPRASRPQNSSVNGSIHHISRLSQPTPEPRHRHSAGRKMVARKMTLQPDQATSSAHRMTPGIEPDELPSLPEVPPPVPSEPQISPPRKVMARKVASDPLRERVAEPPTNTMPGPSRMTQIPSAAPQLLLHQAGESHRPSPDAPYRNTRARSRSVQSQDEPTHAEIRTKQRGKARKGDTANAEKSKKDTALPPVAEDDNFEPPESAPVRNTNTTSLPRMSPAKPPDNSLDPDDAQTRALLSHFPQVSPRPDIKLEPEPEPDLESDDEDAWMAGGVDDLRPSRSRSYWSRGSRPPGSLPSQTSQLSQASRMSPLKPFLDSSRRSALLISPKARTPRRDLIQQMRSVVSRTNSGNFPSPGTRARAERDRQERERKNKIPSRTRRYDVNQST